MPLHLKRLHLALSVIAFFGLVPVRTSNLDAGGKVEGGAISRLSKHKIARDYDKDGKQQKATELLKTGFSMTLATVRESMNGAKATEISKALKMADYKS